MEKEIESVMQALGLRYDQAYRYVRQRRELARRRYAGLTHHLCKPD